MSLAGKFPDLRKNAGISIETRPLGDTERGIRKALRVKFRTRGAGKFSAVSSEIVRFQRTAHGRVERIALGLNVLPGGTVLPEEYHALSRRWFALKWRI